MQSSNNHNPHPDIGYLFQFSRCQPDNDSDIDGIIDSVKQLQFAPSNSALNSTLKSKHKGALTREKPYDRTPKNNDFSKVKVREHLGAYRTIDLSSKEKNWRLESLADLIREAYGEECAIDSVIVAETCYNDQHPIDNKFWRDLACTNRIHVIGHYNCKCPKRIVKLAYRPYSGF